MKKTLWILMAGALAASVIAASAQEVLSANAVGYIKKTMPAEGKLIALAIPLNNMNEANNVFGRTSIAAEAPNLSIVYFWDPVVQQWAASQKSGKGIWPALASNRVVGSGEGFFIKGNPADASPREVTITGEVPDTGPLTRNIVGANALQTVANPFPVDFKFGDSDLAQQLPNLTTVYFWNSDAQQWAASQKSGKGLWPALASNNIVLAGEGFFVKNPGTGFDWNVTKPYTWP